MLTKTASNALEHATQQHEHASSLGGCKEDWQVEADSHGGPNMDHVRDLLSEPCICGLGGSR